MGRAIRARFCLTIFAAVASTLPALAQVSSEYAVRAAYLTKFIPFVDWPAGAFSSPTAPIVICVLGQDSLGASLDRAAAGAGQGRALQIRRIAVPDISTARVTDGCQVVYTNDPDVGLDPLAILQNLPVLTVTEAGMRTQSIINFVTIDNHVRFDIDYAAASKSGLRISSKLLELAHAVTRRDGAP